MQRFLLSIVLFLTGCGAVPATPVRVPSSAPDTRAVVLTFGDSLTAGYGLAEEQGYPAHLQKRLDAAAPGMYRVVNNGVSGDTTAGALERVPWAVKLHPVLAIVVLGGNDGLRGLALEESERNLRGIVDGFTTAGAHVILGGMQLPPNYGPEYIEGFRVMYPRVAAETGATLIPFFLQGVGGVPSLNQRDGIHPTEEGHRIIVDEVLWPAVCAELGVASCE